MKLKTLLKKQQEEYKDMMLPKWEDCQRVTPDMLQKVQQLLDSN